MSIGERHIIDVKYKVFEFYIGLKIENIVVEQKQISILLGAGFSKALANLPLASELSGIILKRLQNHKDIGNYFFDTNNFNYEEFAEFLFQKENTLDYSSKNLKNYSALNNEREFLTQSWEIINSTLLDQLFKFKDKDPFKRRQLKFMDFLSRLTDDNFKIHIFDLNHDLVLNRMLASNQVCFDNFFDYYDEFLPSRGLFQIENKPIKSAGFRKTSLEIVRNSAFHLNFRGSLLKYTNKDCNIFHYKPHGALNLTRFFELPVPAGENSTFPANGLHMFQSNNEKGQIMFNKDFKNNIKRIFKEKCYKDINGNVCRIVPAVICQAGSKGSILTQISLEYFPEVYSRFASLGDSGSALLAIGYGFQDGHFNIAIRNNYKTKDYKSYSKGEAKILLSSEFEISSIKERLKNLDHKTNNENSKEVIYSSDNLEKFLEI